MCAFYACKPAQKLSIQCLTSVCTFAISSEFIKIIKFCYFFMTHQTKDSNFYLFTLPHCFCGKLKKLFNILVLYNFVDNHYIEFVFLNVSQVFFFQIILIIFLLNKLNIINVMKIKS